MQMKILRVKIIVISKYNQLIMNIFIKAFKILVNSFEQHSLLQGASDIIAVKWDTGRINATPFLICFGPSTSVVERNEVKVYVNNNLIQGVKFLLDQYGYLHPMRPTQYVLERLNLQNQRNQITFELNNQQRISCQIFLYRENDRILVSDIDGTLTKNDMGGLYSNYTGDSFLHEGYFQLIANLYKINVKILWLTMRPLPLYEFTKSYIAKHTPINGPLITEPEQLITAVKKQVFKQTMTVKTNMLKTIRELFPPNSTPFLAGLGNNDNDAVAYLAAGIQKQDVFIVDTQSTVHHFGDCIKPITYREMGEKLGRYFLPEYPKLNKTLTYNMMEMSLIDSLELKKQNTN